jgi:hypothetical protein
MQSLVTHKQIVFHLKSNHMCVAVCSWQRQSWLVCRAAAADAARHKRESKQVTDMLISLDFGQHQWSEVQRTLATGTMCLTAAALLLKSAAATSCKARGLDMA